jgi:NAD dependent epimerase/dehydratase family enzyme
MRRPALFPVPGFALKLVLGGFSTEILGSKKVIPQKLIDSGFQFDFPHLAPALAELIDQQ